MTRFRILLIRTAEYWGALLILIMLVSGIGSLAMAVL